MTTDTGTIASAIQNTMGGSQGQQQDQQQVMNSQAGQGGAPSGGGQSGLPPTGIQQQLASLNQQYSQVQGAQTGLGGIGFDPREMQYNQSSELGEAQSQAGGNSLDMLGKRLASSYGLAIGRGRLVDDEGNILVTPEQLAQASGGQETLGTAAAKLNAISEAIAKRQNTDQQKKGIHSIQAGFGAIQNRARGSLATLQSGLYQDLADLYSNQEYEAADFSFWIQKEQNDINAELQRRAEKQRKKAARKNTVLGAGLLVAGIWTGNPVLISKGIEGVSSADETGWW